MDIANISLCFSFPGIYDNNSIYIIRGKPRGGPLAYPITRVQVSQVTWYMAYRKKTMTFLLDDVLKKYLIKKVTPKFNIEITFKGTFDKVPPGIRPRLVVRCPVLFLYICTRSVTANLLFLQTARSKIST